MKTWFAVAVLGAIASCPQVWAQHQHLDNVKEIDGKKNPELIPDNAVYMVVLNNLSLPASPTANDRGFQNAVLDGLKLNVVDRESLRIIAQEFRSAHDAWQARHNTLAQMGGTAFNPQLLRQQHDDLISAARDNIRRMLSASAQESLNKYVKYIRSTIRIHNAGQ